MSRRRRKSRRRAAPVEAAAEQVPDPVDVVDGIPDRSAVGLVWKWALLGAIFLVWVGFLVYCAVTGSP